MQKSSHVLFISALVAIFLPVAVWGYDFFDYHDARNYPAYERWAGGDYHPGSVRVQTDATRDGYYVHAYLEGLRPEDVQIFLRRNRLVLQITQGDQYGGHNPEAHGFSGWNMRFRRQLRLPYDADWRRMTSSSKNGILEIYIPRWN